MFKKLLKSKAPPKKPGVYFFKDSAGQIIYIGKALSLSVRLKSYTQKNLDIKTKSLVKQIKDLDFLVVKSEFEALVLEAKLIKEHRPKYNIRLKDDKRYLYIAISQSPFRVFASRQPSESEGKPGQEDKLLDWFGPFPSSGEVRQVLRAIRRIFPYCSCKTKPRKNCLYAHIGLCPGPDNLASPDYKKDINKIRQILSGKTNLLINKLKKQMSTSAKKLEFEKAQNFKNQLLALQSLTTGWQHVPKQYLNTKKTLLRLRKLLVRYQKIDPTTLRKIEGYDVSNLGKDIVVGSMVAFVDGNPETGLYRQFKIRSQKGIQNDPEGIRIIVDRRLNHPEWIYPQLILVDGGKTQIGAAFEALKKYQLNGKICLLGLTKEKETIVVPQIKRQKIIGFEKLNYAKSNQVLQLLQQIRDESHRFAQKYYKKLHHNKIL